MQTLPVVAPVDQFDMLAPGQRDGLEFPRRERGNNDGLGRKTRAIGALDRRCGVRHGRNGNGKKFSSPVVFAPLKGNDLRAHRKLTLLLAVNFKKVVQVLDLAYVF